MEIPCEQSILEWLLDGDPSVQYRTRLELLGENAVALEGLRSRIACEGWGRTILDAVNPGGGWGERYYQPKWLSTHYTLIELMRLGMPPDTPEPVNAAADAVDRFLDGDGGFHCFGTPGTTDTCVTGMFLETASYFGVPEEALTNMADFLIGEVMADGGWNCRTARSGAVHSSVHTTISCLEGFRGFRARCPGYRSDEVRRIVAGAEYFLLQHQLAYSHRTGEVIHPDMLKLSWPSRWKFDILRGLEYFADAERSFDAGMQRALDVLAGRRRKDGTWPVQNRHPGQVHVQMKKTGGPSRWNTFRALKVLNRLPQT